MESPTAAKVATKLKNVAIRLARVARHCTSMDGCQSETGAKLRYNRIVNVKGKIKGFPYWPAKIIDPNEKPALKRSRKKVFVVQFFGTGEYGCIGLEDMRPYFAFKQKFCVASRKDNFIRAMVECERYVAQNPNMETLETKLNQPTDDEYYQRWVKNCRDDESDAASDELGYFTVAKKPKLETLAEIASEERLNVETARNSEEKGRNKKTKNEGENSIPAKNGSFRRTDNSAVQTSDQAELKPISKRIGFIGLGKVGSNLAKRFIKMGNDVLLCSRSVKVRKLPFF
uniref:PWWP domain-containing protein n=1 Tax=Romanomermis culicivorax TaxID=13658 RepID=A0A915IEM7_ROMCU